MKWNEYIDIDNELKANEILTLEEIVNIVKKVEEPEEAETKSSIMPISHKTALQDCEEILQYINENTNLDVDESLVRNLQTLKKKYL